MGDGEGETKKTHRHQKVRFNSACNETHVLEREVSSASSSSTSSDLSNQSESTITENDVANSDTTSLDLSPHSSSGVGYDPNRIPSSIFNSTPGNDWSVASNESLFSITMGNNNSFSRDQGFLLYKSGELMKLDEVFNLPISLPPVAEGAAVERESGEEEEEEEEIIKGSPSPKEKKVVVDLDPCKPKIVGGGGDDLRNSVRVSDGSAASNSSFAFPILISQDTKNASNKSERGAAVKQVENTRPQQQSSKQPERKKSSPPPPPPPPKTRTLTSWFCCFSCCSFRCSMSLK